MASTLPFYPTRIGDQILWLNNFRNKLPNYGTVLGYTTDEVTAIQGDCDRLAWLMDTLQGAAQSFSHAVTAHIKLLKTGTGSVIVAPPAFTIPSSPAPPANVLPGALKRLMKVISNLKTRTGYTITMGEDLGIVGAEEPAPNPETTKPEIKAVLAAGGKVEIQWKKGVFTGVRIEVDRGNGQWVFLAVDTEPHYIDTASPAAGTAAVWKYRAIYLEGDANFGQWSDTVSIAVQG